MSDFKIQLPKEMFDPAEFMRVEEKSKIEPITFGPDTYTFDDPMDLDLTITNTGGAFLIQGSIKGIASTACARCLESATLDIDADVEGFVVIDEQESDLEDVEGDEYTILGSDKIIDLRPFIESAILLDLPQIPLCKDDCKGLCPKCGCNLNTDVCDCEDAPEPANPNNPFAILKDLDLSK